MDVILKRRSIRKYLDKSVPMEIIKELLVAAMAAPTAGNKRPWEFIVVLDKETINKIAEVHPSKEIIKGAPLIIIVCYDENLEKADGCGIQDTSAAMENILLEACDKGLGTCWLGVYNRKDRISGVKSVMNLPHNIMPMGMVAIGYGAEEKGSSDKYDESKVHWGKW